jgi:hypothetical protein
MSRLGALLILCGLLIPRGSGAQTPPDSSLPSLEAMRSPEPSAMRPLVQRFTEDREALLRRYDAKYAPERWRRLEQFYTHWEEQLAAVNYDGLGVEGRIDHVLLRNEIQQRQHRLDRARRRAAEMERYIPFASTITDLFYAWRAGPEIDPRAAADTLARLRDRIARLRRRVDGEASVDAEGRVVAHRAANAVDDLRSYLEEWYTFYDGYHPDFAWWVEQPYQEARQGLADYRTFLRREVVGIEPEAEKPLIGDPIGREALQKGLQYEMIPYSPEELIALARQELAWGKARMREAARAMGHGDDWRAALEAVKTRHVAPGEQPALIQDLADEAVSFLRERDLVTIPPLATEVWRMTMLSPEWQRTSPYFLGGEVVRIAFPSESMTHENKLMSIRGNNRHFSRAVVHHELIPGHHLQGFMTDRYKAYRGAFATPFWGEGWAFYWETRLWDLDFPRSPEDRIGMLFWRNHRAARILFSLRFHMGEMSGPEAVDFLVQEVGHERANARAEVRRSILGTYPPLYQASYMVGGLQFRALHDELVENGEMSNRTFHDRILKGGRMPVELVRARLRGEQIPKDYESSWRFYGTPTDEE